MIVLRADELGRQIQRCFRNAQTTGRKGLSLQNAPLTDSQEIDLVRKTLPIVHRKRALVSEMRAFFSQVKNKDAHLELLQKELLSLDKEQFSTLLFWLEILLPESKSGIVFQGISIQNAVARELNKVNTELGSCSYYIGKLVPSLGKEQQEKVKLFVEEFNK
ncbi:hypothetical protein HYX14_04595 [Candidatus Woesearchaeota archaeon]|nr:hypothetical protein [Candidatus Woesearchaeota archaeon]